MNDNIFASFDTFYSPILPTELVMPQMQLTDADLASPTYYLKDLNAPPHMQNEHERQHQHIYHHPPKQQVQYGSSIIGSAPSGSAQDCTGGSSNSVPINIPFVQIHTTDVQPQSSYNGSKYRRTVSNHEEIKSEPIKSESADAAKERANFTPTPPGPGALPRSSSSNNDTEREANASQTISVAINGAMVADAQHENATAEERCDLGVLSAIYRCTHCMFIGLSENAVSTHTAAVHKGDLFNRPPFRIPCPGCDNIFYSQNSVAIHLREDHLMIPCEAEMLIHAIKEKYNCLSQTTEKSISHNMSETEESAEKHTQRRSRIYLKNVECLREPRREPIEQQDNLMADNFFPFENDGNTMTHMIEDHDFIGMIDCENLNNNKSHSHNHGHNLNHNQNRNQNSHEAVGNDLGESESNKVSNANAPKQKISIKSVDVLREPTLLRRDYELQSFNFMSPCNDVAGNGNNGTDGCNSASSNDQFNYTSATRSMVNASDSNLTHGNDDCVMNRDNLETIQKPRRPKIYIKNVDILKEPMLFAANDTSAVGMQDANASMTSFGFIQPPLNQPPVPYLENAENLSTSAQGFDNTATLKQLPLGALSDQYLFDNGSSFLPSVGEMAESLSYISGPNNNGFLENNRYGNAMDCGIGNSSLQPGTVPIITEPTPPPLPILPMPTAPGNKNTEPAIETSLPVLHTQIAANTVPTSMATAPAHSQKQKIFIKNVDILKEPQFQEQRGTLHLRTVDELNLMNKREVQNLIAPNLENSQANANFREEELNENFTNLSTNAALPELEEVAPTEDVLYENDVFKLPEFPNQGVPNWSDDYALGEDIGEMITETIAPMDNFSNTIQQQKTIQDLDTPQMSIISIRDIEELTSEHHPPPTANNAFGNSLDAGLAASESDPAGDTLSEIQRSPSDTTKQTDTFVPLRPLIMDADCLKQERSSTTVAGVQKNLVTETVAANFDNIPPLTLMSTTSTASHIATITPTKTSGGKSTLPVPPLVLMSPIIQLNTSAAKTDGVEHNPVTATTTVPVERGRIYVANNLMRVHPTSTVSNTTKNTTTSISTPATSEEKQAQNPIAVAVTGGTSVRGRPFGSNRTGITKMRKQSDKNAAAIVYVKCTVPGCAFRFKKSETLEYHLRCHNSDVNLPSAQAMLCPECKSTDFTNWNTLHTHLWRTHKVDMELYSCELCAFKTPIYSRLLNTHSKIHYDARNYKCDQCEKAFKNTKQLKNHRRWHRNHTSATTVGAAANKASEEAKKVDASTTPALTIYRCKHCDAVFSHRKTLREHSCKNAEGTAQCKVCDRVFSSKSSLKLHSQTHQPNRRFKCDTCDYATSDHNAFRRHKMTHNDAKMYKCANCDYKSIQSVAYQKHIQQKHPDIADSVIHKCTLCHYATINQALFTLHCAKHENNNNEQAVDSSSKPAAETTCEENAKKLEPIASKIKVKSHLMLSLPTPAAAAVGSLDENNVDSSCVTSPMPMFSVEMAII